MTTKVNCPQCQTEVIWNHSSLYRPFCSKRCQLLDLGTWATEDHVIAGETPDEVLAHSSPDIDSSD